MWTTLFGATITISDDNIWRHQNNKNVVVAAAVRTSSMSELGMASLMAR